MKTRWLDRRISIPGPYLCLCLSNQEYRAVLKRLKLDSSEPWITQNANATTHIRHDVAGLAAIVCLGSMEGRTEIEVAGLLVHEAVHVWQEWCEHYGERHPAAEQEAYAIQAISQELMAEYARRLKEVGHDIR